jgi:hypothetical protein
MTMTMIIIMMTHQIWMTEAARSRRTRFRVSRPVTRSSAPPRDSPSSIPIRVP